MSKERRFKGRGKSITLQDVLMHIGKLRVDVGSMERRLTTKIDANSKEIRVLASRMDVLADRIDSVGEDLTATMKDTIHIRRHVGMPVQDEE